MSSLQTLPRPSLFLQGLYHTAAATFCYEITCFGNLGVRPSEQRMFSKRKISFKKIYIEKKISILFQKAVLLRARLLLKHHPGVLFVVGTERGPVIDVIGCLSLEDHTNVLHGTKRHLRIPHEVSV